jgi:hypothetical protein
MSLISGRIASANLTTSAQTIHQVPSGFTASFSANFCNTTTSAVSVRLAIATTSSPSSAEWVIYDAIVAANSSIMYTGLVADQAQLVVALASATGCNINLFGYQETR